MKSPKRPLSALFIVGGALLWAGCTQQSPEQLVQSARAMLARNENGSAVIQLKNALQHQPDSADARLLLGQALLASGDAGSAVVEFRKASALGKSAEEVLPPLGRALLMQGEYRRLVEELGQSTLANAQAMADLTTTIGTARASLADGAGARAAAIDALRRVPNYAPALLLQARLLAAQQKFSEAEAVVDKAVAAAPNDPEVRVYQGDALLRIHKDGAGALQAYRRALELKPNHVGARVNLVGALIGQHDLKAAELEIAPLRRSQPGSAQVAYLDAQLAFAQGDLKRADSRIQQVLKVAPDNVNTLLMAGQIASRNNAPVVAERWFSKALSLAPQSEQARRQLAAAYLLTGQPERALTTVAPLLAADPADLASRRISAEAQMIAGNYAAARTELVEVLKLVPKDVRSRTAMAVAQLNLGKGDVAIAELRSIAAADKGIFADMALVSVALSKGDFATAMAAIDAVERKQPGKASSAELRGRVFVLQGREADARKSYERALALEPAYLPAIANLARLDLKDGQRATARKRFEKVLAIQPGNVAALLAIASIRGSEGAPAAEIADLLKKAIQADPTEPSARLTLAQHHLAQGDRKAALAVMREAEAALPDNADVIDMLGRMQVASGDTHQAIATLQRLAVMEPRSIRAPMRMAATYLVMKDYAAAMRSFKHALDIEPESLPAHQGYLETALTAGRTADALTLARAVEKRHPDALIGYLLEARVKVFERRYDDAAQLYRTALEKGPSTDAAIKLHGVLLSAGHLAEAGRFAQEWRTRFPKDVEFLAHLGDSAMARKDDAAAETYFRELLELQPENPRALNNVAWLLLRQGKPGAVAYAERADKLRANAPELIDTLASALAADQQIERALVVQKKALMLAPDNAVLRLNLARLYIQAGMGKSAKVELETLAKLGGQFEQQTEVSKLLKTL